MKLKTFVLLSFLIANSTRAWQQIKPEPYAPELFPEGTSGGVCGFSPDSQTIYFVRADAVGENSSIYQATRMGDQWGKVTLLPFSGKHNDSGGRLSPAGDKFYFTSDRPGGSSDPEDKWNVWVVEREGIGWRSPQALHELNNSGDQCCPAVLDDSSFLFSGNDANGNAWQVIKWSGGKANLISSINQPESWQWPSYFDPQHKVLLLNSMKREETIGKDDLYISFYEQGQWSAPIILPEPINSEAYEDGAILSPDGDLIFNRHTSWDTPSKVLKVPWSLVLKLLNKK